MLLIKGSVMIGTYWYREWHNPPNGILPIGINAQNGHAYVAHGWKQVDGKPHLIIQAWNGREYLMPRETFNAAMKPLGMQTWVLSTAEMNSKREKSLTEIIKDLMLNLIIRLKDLIRKEDIEVIPVVVIEDVTPKYQWGTKEEARHSVRVICDEELLTTWDKNDLCATVGAESNWNPRAIGKKNGDGSTDYGICQINDHYWIGKGKQFPSTDYVLENPEACIRWMCRQWKMGNKNWWYGYKNGSYKKYL